MIFGQHLHRPTFLCLSDSLLFLNPCIAYSHDTLQTLSEWQSVIAVSLNLGDQVGLVKPAKLCIQTQRGWTHGTGCWRQWFCTPVPLGELELEYIHFANT